MAEAEKSDAVEASRFTDLLDDLPTIGLTPFDAWFSELMVLHMAALGFVPDEPQYWREFFDGGMMPKDALAEELSYYA